MNARAYTTNTTKQETSADYFGNFTKGCTTYRIKEAKFLEALGMEATNDSVAKVQNIFIAQEGKGDWGAYVGVNGELVGAGCTLQECFEYLINNHF